MYKNGQNLSQTIEDCYYISALGMNNENSLTKINIEDTEVS